jgi:hypothetical protein
MALLTGLIVPDGAIITILVGVSALRELRLRRAGFPVPTRMPVDVQLDTGASVSGFMSQVFQQLAIPALGPIPLRTPSTTAQTPFVTQEFNVSLTLVAGTTVTSFPSVDVIESPNFDPNEPFQGIIGRDILNLCDFNYSGKHGVFSLAF